MVSIYGGCCTIEGAGNDPYITGIEQELAINLAPLELLLREEVPVDGTALDIGANVGVTSIMTGRHLRDGRVLAFEPDRKAYTFLQRNIERNGLTNIQLFGLAVSQAEGTLAFEEVVDASFASHVAPSAILEEDHAIGQDSQDSKVARRSIPTTTVDSIINTNELQRVDLIK